MQTILDTFKIAKKDLIEFSRDRVRLITFIIMPIFMMVMTGFIFPSQSSIKDIKIGIANADSGNGQKLADVLTNVEITKGSHAFIIQKYNNGDEIKEAIKKQKINGGVVIPADFSEALSGSRQAQVTIVQDQSNPQVSAIVTQSLTGIIQSYGQGIEEQKVAAILVSKSPVSRRDEGLIKSIINPIQVTMTGLFPGETNYFEFVAPGIMAMVVMTAVLTGLAASVSREKEQGTLDGILISPITRLSIVLGKALSQSVRGLAQGAVVMLLAIFLFGVTINGSILLVALILLLGIFSFVGLGILVSASATEQETATQLLFMFQFPMLFLSGAFFPIQQMPAVMQTISHLIPLTYGIEALRKVIILGGGSSSVSNDLLILTGFGAVTLAIAVPTFKKMITR